MMLGVKADFGLSYRKIEGIANGVRAKLSLEPLERFPSMEFFESTVHKWSKFAANGQVHFYFGVKSLRGSEGITCFDQNTRTVEMYLSESSYDEFTQQRPRAVFSAVHEFGHAHLHTNQLIRLANLHIEEKAAFHRNVQPYPNYQDTEWQANAFAGAVLMPATGLQALKDYRGGHLFPDDIAQTYGVSLDAAVTRSKVFNEHSF